MYKPLILTACAVVATATAIGTGISQRAVADTLTAHAVAPNTPTPVKAEGAVSDQEITDAYLYLLGRLLILRQERLDFETGGFQWNKLVHHAPGGVSWANPNLDVAYSEAWVAVDEKTCVLLSIPRIKGRYYTWQMLNGWGETLLNINERTFPDHPYGQYALCLKGSHTPVPASALRVDLPVKTARVLARVELGSDPDTAVRLQHEFRLSSPGTPQIPPTIQVPLFANKNLPGVEAFDLADAVLDGEPDINPGMEKVRAQLRAVAALARSSENDRRHIQQVIEQQSLPAFAKIARAPGELRDGWIHASTLGNYGSNYAMRTAVDLGGIWANNAGEYTGFVAHGLDGSVVYTQTYPKDSLPQAKVKYFWSITAVDTASFKVIPNVLNRYVINRETGPQPNADGSLTLVFAPRLPGGVPQENWLPTPEGAKYNLTFRFYGPTSEVASGQYFPPPLTRQN